MNDPLGLVRSYCCDNAFEYDRDDAATRATFGAVADGGAFICRYCAARTS